MWRRRRGRQRDSEPADVYLGLRGQVLELDPAEAGIHPSEALPGVWGGMMELGFPEATASLVCLADGTTSLYTSTGGGIIGGGGHEAVAGRAHAFLRELEQRLEHLPPEDEAALPEDGQVVLRALGHAGRRAVLAGDAELGSGEHALSPVFRAGHDVITELRLIEEDAGRA